MGLLDVPGISRRSGRNLFAGRPPAVALLTSAHSSAPTINDLAATATGIAGSTLIGYDDPVFTHLGPALAVGTDSRFMTCARSSDNIVVTTWACDFAAFELYVLASSTRVFLEYQDIGMTDFVPAMSAQLTPAGSAGAPDLISVTFPQARPRLFRLTMKGAGFGGIRALLSAGRAWSWQDRRPLMVFNGDSYTDGTGANARSLTYSATCARLLGHRWWAEGVGGTGYATTGTNSLATRVAATNNVLVQRVGGTNTAVAPDVVVWPYGYNDGSPASAATVAQVEAGFDAAYAAAARKPDVLWGCWTPAGNTTKLDAVDAALSAKAAAVGAQFVSLRNWVTATNAATYIGGDLIHPNQYGHDYYGVRGAQSMSALGW